jgi:ankyrin repeat protein
MSNSKLYVQCRNGDLKAVENEIKLGATDYDYGLYGACIGGRMNIVKYLLKLGATDYNYGLLQTGKNGNMEIAKLMVKLGATMYDMCLDNACGNGHMNIVEYMVKLGAKNCFGGLHEACRHGHTNIVKYLFKYGSVSHKYRSVEDLYYSGLFYGHSSNCTYLMILILESGATDFNKFFNYKSNKYFVIELIRTGLDPKFLNTTEGYDLLIKDLDGFKQETKALVSQYLLDPIINIIQSYYVL